MTTTTPETAFDISKLDLSDEAKIDIELALNRLENASYFLFGNCWMSRDEVKRHEHNRNWALDRFEKHGVPVPEHLR